MSVSYKRIPIGQDAPWFDFPISLSGVRYVLEIRYNTRSQRWAMTISDASGNPVLCGIPLLVARDLTAQYSTLALPPGVMVAVDQSGQNLQPTLQSFLTDHALLYGDPLS